jgi:hypothetical protein
LHRLLFIPFLLVCRRPVCRRGRILHHKLAECNRYNGRWAIA